MEMGGAMARAQKKADGAKRRTLSVEERRDAILDAAKLHLVDCGFAGLRMDDVARSAGLSKGGVYFHFPSKEAVVLGVVHRENARIQAQLERVPDRAASVFEQIESQVGGVFAYLVGNRDVAKINQTLTDEALRNPELQAEIHRGEEIFCGYLESLLQRGVERGEIDPAIDPAVSARLAMIVIEGIKAKYLHFPDWPWASLLSTLAAWFRAHLGPPAGEVEP